MEQQTVKERRGNTPPVQRRANRTASAVKLARRLAENFSDGASLITLTYCPGGYVPIGIYAESDIKTWVRWARKEAGRKFPYARTTEQRDGPVTVHRVIVAAERAEAERLAVLWEYGPAAVEKVKPACFPTLAESFTAEADRPPCKRSWTGSLNLKR